MSITYCFYPHSVRDFHHGLLDEAEGLHHGYEEKAVDVVTANSVKTAVMYYATSKDPSLKPYHGYKALVVAGAVEHELPFPYVEWLRTIESVQDQDPARRMEHERLLSTWQRTNEAGLRTLSDAPTAAMGQIVREPSRVRLELTQPGRVVIVIQERYTEDIIFSQLAKDFRNTYLDWLKDSDFAAHVAAFHAALARNGRHYVVNMAVADRYDPTNLGVLVNQGVIVPFEDPTKLEDLIDVLYQVRCNVFHGEKAPYDPNDDQIVKAAHPLLLFIVEKLDDTLPTEDVS